MGLFSKKVQRFGGNPESLPVKRETKTYLLSDFEIFETLGTGTFGRVRLVRSIAENQHYALKIIKKTYVLQMSQLDHIKSEVKLLRLLRHPFIVTLHSNFQDELRLYLLMEFVIGGELYALLRNAGRFHNDRAKYYAAEVVLVLEYLHGMHVAYRALKPENVLIDANGNVKIIDFGFAKVVHDRTFTPCGTPEYLAPEVITNVGHGKSVDWWALGVLIFEMSAGHPPFFDTTPFGIYEKILSGKVDMPPNVDDKAKAIAKRLLQIDRTKRLGCGENGADDLKAHGWFSRTNWDALYYGQCKSPHRPETSGARDTRHFDRYPDSEPGIEEPLDGKGQALFHDFDQLV